MTGDDLISFFWTDSDLSVDLRLIKALLPPLNYFSNATILLFIN
jgi:hypothetical protein